MSVESQNSGEQRVDLFSTLASSVWICFQF